MSGYILINKIKTAFNTCKTSTKLSKMECDVNANVINTPMAETFPEVIIVRCNIKPGYKMLMLMPISDSKTVKLV